MFLSDRRTFRRGCWLGAVLLATSTAGVEAQAPSAGAGAAVLEGVAVAAEDGRPVALAMVSIPALNRRIFAGDDGSFRLGELPAGRHRMRIEQIGRVGVDTAVVVPMETTDPRGYVIELPARVIALEGLDAVGTPGECRTRGFRTGPDEPRALQASQVMDELRKNADRYRLLLDRHPVTVRWARVQQLRDGGSVLSQQTDTMVHSSQDSRKEYRPGGILERATDARGSPVFNLLLPSMYTLGDPEFQGSHCFRYAGLRSDGGRRVHRMDFVTLADDTEPGVEGSLFIDAQSHLLRRTELRVVNLPPEVPFDRVRAETTYREISPGIVLVERGEASRRVRGPRVGGRTVDNVVHVQTLVDFRFPGTAPGGG